MKTNENKGLILIVDDLSVNLQVLASILFQDNYEIAVAENGNMALDMLKNVSPDLILLDIMMPDIDGYDVCQKIKENENLRDIPVIFLTAKTDSASVIRSFEVGAADYITKPFNAAELKARVKTHISLRKQKIELENLNSHLEEKVREKTFLLENANIRLNKLDNAKNYFLGLLSHELITPVNQIKAALKLLSMEKAFEDETEIFNDMNVSVGLLEKFAHISSLITSLKAEKYKMNLSETNLYEFFQEILFDMKKEIEDNNIQINIENYLTNHFIKIDNYLFRQALMIIFNNAFKHTPFGGSVRILLSSSDNTISINIIDSGKGFSEEYLTNQFELFSTDNLLNHNQGFGLGLTAAKLIIEAHNGSLSISNQKNGGANVAIALKIDGW